MGADHGQQRRALSAEWEARRRGGSGGTAVGVRTQRAGVWAAGAAAALGELRAAWADPELPAMCGVGRKQILVHPLADITCAGQHNVCVNVFLLQKQY